MQGFRTIVVNGAAALIGLAVARFDWLDVSADDQTSLAVGAAVVVMALVNGGLRLITKTPIFAKLTV